MNFLIVWVKFITEKKNKRVVVTDSTYRLFMTDIFLKILTGLPSKKIVEIDRNTSPERKLSTNILTTGILDSLLSFRRDLFFLVEY